VSGAEPSLAVCRLDELQDPGSREFGLPAGQAAFTGFVLRVQGQLRSYLNLCPHARRPLNYLPHRFLTADGSAVLCTGHGALFDPLSGECVAGPCQGRSLSPLAVECRDGMVWVRLPRVAGRKD
jgi:nitrite reductase/ring-hydroxylating ferredoxin subunit